MIESVPGVVASGEILRIPGSLLFTTTSTPPWFEAPRYDVSPRCRPLAVVAFAADGIEMAGAGFTYTIKLSDVMSVAVAVR